MTQHGEDKAWNTWSATETPFPPGLGSGAELTTEAFREQCRSSGSNPLSLAWFEILFCHVFSAHLKGNLVTWRGGGEGQGVHINKSLSSCQQCDVHLVI